MFLILSNAHFKNIYVCKVTAVSLKSNLYTGVGQSEFAVADMVDMFVLLIPPAGGDELQVHTLSLLGLYSHRSDSQTRSMGPQQTSMETLR